MENYLKRLIEIGKNTTMVLEKCKTMAITDDEKIAVAHISYLLGYIEALENTK